MQKLIVENINQLEEVAKQFVQDVLNEKANIYAFQGEMGVGKTTFIAAICKVLGVEENTSSPSFSIVNEYHITQEKKIYHFDAYRIKNIKEFYYIGYEDYFFSGDFCFIEWPEKVSQLLPENCVYIEMYESHGKRIIKY